MGCDETLDRTWFDEFSDLTRAETVKVHRRVGTVRGQPVYSGFVEFERSLTLFQPRRIVTETGETSYVAGDCYLAPGPIIRTVDRLELFDGSFHRILAVDRYEDEAMEPNQALQRVGFI